MLAEKEEKEIIILNQQFGKILLTSVNQPRKLLKSAFIIAAAS